jgi:IS30 family transposase
MGQINYNTESRKGIHLIYEERIKLEALYQSGLTPTDIGYQLGDRARRTIEREIAKGLYERVRSDLTVYMTYSADVGQLEHDRRGTAKGPALKIGKDHELAEYLENSIKEGNSPYSALQNIKNQNKHFETTICVKTFYNYLDDNLFLGISNKDLLVKKDGKKRDYHKIRQAITNTKGTSIADRPAEIDNRDEIGHWEMDTVVGKQGTKAVLLVLSERMMRKELIFKITGKTQEEVIRIIDDIESKIGSIEFSQVFKSITTDNGGEFLNFEGIDKSLFNKEEKRTKMYFAHPYSSWERGTNENINKMIRRFIPKGVDISNYSDEDIERIQNWINNYPRRILGGLSANMLEQKYIAA